MERCLTRFNCLTPCSVSWFVFVSIIAMGGDDSRVDRFCARACSIDKSFCIRLRLLIAAAPDGDCSRDRFCFWLRTCSTIPLGWQMKLGLALSLKLCLQTYLVFSNWPFVSCVWILFYFCLSLQTPLLICYSLIPVSFLNMAINKQGLKINYFSLKLNRGYNFYRLTNSASA